MNGVMGNSQKDNSMFYITNASSIEDLNNAFSDWFKNHMPEVQVEFIGRAKMGEGNDYDALLTSILLKVYWTLAEVLIASTALQRSY
ncbi:hypothetical protein AB8970_14365 [Yersinia enterocolitica]|uniref:hypothetical protein n=2 Tax=Yersinia enterocolitica TaxID=630 RepID=UPI00094BA618|nr:hypothetical protein [Yersinia enterocolitica]HDL8053389.1 hypothetical protein [Yersinia enterocolitica]HEN3635799.1 hypothetical protein [Yersinia enterocolitica]HEN3644584.1 hypothetical protein [Yersinia enterocolitica]